MADAFSTTLLRASYAGVEFPVGKCETEGGHDSVEHAAYRRDGADVEPTGVKAEHGSMEALFFNNLRGWGTIWPGRLQELLTAIKRNPIATLQHPTEGLLTAHLKVWKRTLEPERRSGEVVELQWVEHNASVSRLATFADATPTDSPSAAQDQAAAADTAPPSTSAAGYVPVAPVVATQLAYLEAAPRSYPQVAVAIGVMLGAVDANLALPSLAGATAHDTVAALYALRGTVYALRDRYLPDLARVRKYTVPATQPLWQLALTLYGDVTLASLLLRANAVPDTLFVPAGTVLTVPPAP